MSSAEEIPTSPFMAHVLGIVREAKVPVSALLDIARERLDEDRAADSMNMRRFLDTRAASKDAKIIKDAGEAISVDTVRSLLRIGKAAVHKAKDEGRLLAFQEPGRRTYLFPAFQFRGPVIAAWIPELIELVGNGLSALHFLTVERKSLGGLSFLERIREADTEENYDAAVKTALDAAREIQV